ncbi:MAG TPA: SidA/IucD/PvdA family monooxygenase [Puia sp.]|nr:SidA/IucD/PvdA family monooxygenase [Puia sp.]
MKRQTVHDLIGIGIGPFNLGLAALAHDIPNLKTLFFDKQESFNWHAGMLLDNARLQVPFFADLVTLSDPRSKFSYLNYKHARGRLIPFGIHEKYYILRKEYNEYCRWVAAQLSNLHFGCACESVRFIKTNKIFEVTIKENSSRSTLKFYAKRIVLGVGNVPNIPSCALPLISENIIHSSNFLFSKEKLLTKRKITILGSGQSAAEIFYDILQESDRFDQLYLFTRAPDFFPMDYSRFALEKTSPDYIDYFFSLSNNKKKEVLNRQNALYKGINFSLIADIHDSLDALRLMHPLKKIGLVTSSELKEISLLRDSPDKIKMNFYHQEMEKEFKHSTESVILATGYKYETPDFLQPVKELIRWNGDGLYDVKRNYSIDNNDSIFIQNAELHTHGFNAPDLGMGPFRNAVILNSILGKEHFKTERNIVFQTFGISELEMEE